MTNYTERLKTFTENDLPDLDEVVLGALELFAETPVPEIDFQAFARPLVVGSGNAAVTGRLLYSHVDAVYADESSYVEKLDTYPDIDGAILISASGSKHALPIAAELERRQIKTILLTNNPEAPAKERLIKDDVFVFPKNREPYTYNASTYMGMLLSKTGEDTEAIIKFIESTIKPKLPSNLANYGAYYFIIPEKFNVMGEMIGTKFNELFGPRVMGRIFTLEQTKHAKTVINLETELFVSLGEENVLFGKPENRLHIPLPLDANYVAFMAISYYFVGQLQKQLPPYFKNRIAQYAHETSQLFGSTIKVIVK